MNINELKRMEQPELIKLIDTGQLIHIDNINGNNMVVIDRLSNEGYCVVSNTYAKRSVCESANLAKAKVRLKEILKEMETET